MKTLLCICMMASSAGADGLWPASFSAQSNQITIVCKSRIVTSMCLVNLEQSNIVIKTVLNLDGEESTSAVKSALSLDAYEMFASAVNKRTSAVTIDDVYDAICRVEDASGSYSNRVHRDGISYGSCGMTYQAVSELRRVGLLTCNIDLTRPAHVEYCGRMYLRLLVERHGSLWASVCHWNKGREKYAAKVWETR